MKQVEHFNVVKLIDSFYEETEVISLDLLVMSIEI